MLTFRRSGRLPGFDMRWNAAGPIRVTAARAARSRAAANERLPSVVEVAEALAEDRGEQEREQDLGARHDRAQLLQQLAVALALLLGLVLVVLHELSSSIAVRSPCRPTRRSAPPGEGGSYPATVGRQTALLHPAVLDPQGAGGGDGLQQAAVVGDQQDGPGEGAEGLLDLLEGRQVEVVGRLVEHQAVDAPALQEGEAGPGALARRQRAGGAQDVLGAEAELGQQRPGLGHGVDAGRLLEGVEQGAVAVEQGPALVDLADDDARPEALATGGQLDAAEQGVEQGRLARAVGADDGDPVGPADLQVDRARG